jgi:alkylation response protein AidB-like acyl-CoA dehydrogenase
MTEAFRFERSARESSLLEQAEAIARRHPRPEGRPFDKNELRAICRELAPTGYLASTLPKAAGGHGLTPLEFASLVEGLSPELTLLGNHSVQRYLHSFASEAQQRRFLPALLEGESVGAISMTETEAGSDLERMKTVARREGSAYVIDGEKTWVTHGMSADVIVVLANTDAGLTRFLVPGDTPGLEREPLAPVGLGHLAFARLRFNGCEVPADLRLGGEGEGLKGAKAAFPIARVLVAFQNVRIARAALRIAREYIGTRHVAHTSLAASSLVQSNFSHLSARCDATELLALRVASRLDAADAVPSASGVKALSGELAMETCRWVEDLLGSTSLDAHHPLHRLTGDARMMSVVDGTSVLNHLVAARRALPSQGEAR